MDDAMLLDWGEAAVAAMEEDEGWMARGEALGQEIFVGGGAAADGVEGGLERRVLFRFSRGVAGSSCVLGVDG